MATSPSDVKHVSRKAFADVEIFDQELERIFRRCWLFVGHESEIASPGDYVTRKMGRDPVILTRDENRAVRVFLNSCRHRGAALCAADIGNTSHFRCSYHGWTYSNSGALRGVPFMRERYGAAFTKADLGLVQPAHVDTLFGCVFATWDPTAPSLRDYLGPMAWYMETAFGKAEHEVVGPPSRILVRHNWKIGFENYTPDTYHVPTTHKNPVDMGVYGPEHLAGHDLTAKHLGELLPDANPYDYRPWVCDLGHTGTVLKVPMRFSKPTFLGYEDHLWPTFERNLTPDQVELRTGLNLLMGDVFPNTSWLEYVVPYNGDSTPPVMAHHVRVWQPVSPGVTEVVMWALVPKDASPEWKLWSQRAFVRILGMGGSFETDDYQNWVSMQDGLNGPIGREATQHYEADGASLASDVNWPGTVLNGDATDLNFRAVYGRWQELMNGDGASAVASPSSEHVDNG
jgi:PAH dioxygenase large subunit